MKKIMIAFVTGIALFVLGLGVLFGGIIGLRTKKTEASQSHNFVEKVYECQNQGISYISTALVNEDVNIQVCDIDRITITYHDDINEPLYVIKETGSELKISRGKQINGAISYNFSILDFSDLISAKDVFEEDAFPVEIAVPKTYAGDYNLNSISGNINITEANVKGDIQVETVSGDASLKECEASENVSINTVSGDIWLETVAAKETIACNTISGMIEGSGVDATQLQTDSTSGDIAFSKLNIGNEFCASSTSGSVNLKILDSIDNYDFSVETISGSCNVPRESERGKEKYIDISTTSGDILILSETE